MARKKKVKTPKFTIRNVDKKEFARLQRNAKAMITSRQKKFGIDISDKIDVRSDINSFKSRSEFNLWKESMSKLKYRADLQFKQIDEKTVASKSQINEATKKAKKVISDKLSKRKGKKDTYINKFGIEFTKGEVIKAVIQTTVAQDMEKGRQKELSEIPRLNKKGEEIKKGTVKKEKDTEVRVRGDFDPSNISSTGDKERKKQDLGNVSDPERYKRRQGQLKENQMEKLLWTFGDDADDVLQFFNAMDEKEFNNFYFMFKQSSMGFDAYDSKQYYGSKDDVDDKQLGALEQIRTDIGRYTKDRNWNRKLENI